MDDKARKWINRVGQTAIEKELAKRYPEHCYIGDDAAYSPLRCHILRSCRFDFKEAEHIQYLLDKSEPIAYLDASLFRKALRGESPMTGVSLHSNGREKLARLDITKRSFNINLILDSMMYAEGIVEIRYVSPRTEKAAGVLVGKHPFGTFFIVSKTF